NNVVASLIFEPNQIETGKTINIHVDDGFDYVITKGETDYEHLDSGVSIRLIGIKMTRQKAENIDYEEGTVKDALDEINEDVDSLKNGVGIEDNSVLLEKI